jgi:hypothetical protein
MQGCNVDIKYFQLQQERDPTLKPHISTYRNEHGLFTRDHNKQVLLSIQHCLFPPYYHYLMTKQATKEQIKCLQELNPILVPKDERRSRELCKNAQTL